MFTTAGPLEVESLFVVRMRSYCCLDNVIVSALMISAQREACVHDSKKILQNSLVGRNRSEECSAEIHGLKRAPQGVTSCVSERLVYFIKQKQKVM